MFTFLCVCAFNRYEIMKLKTEKILTENRANKYLWKIIFKREYFSGESGISVSASHKHYV